MPGPLVPTPIHTQHSPSAVPLRVPQQAEPPPPLRRPRRGPRLKLSALSAPLSAGSSAPGPRLGAFPGAMVLPVSEPPPAPPATLTSATEGEAAVGAEGAAPGAAECETKAIPPASDNIGGSVGVYGTSAVVQPNGWGADNPKDGLPAGKGDGPAAKPSRSQPEEAVPAGIKPQVGESDPAGLKSEGYPSVAATAAAAAAAVGENCVGRSSQMSEDSVATPGQQDMIPAGLLWSDFGGGREEGEDAEETASREFAEESFGIFHGVRLDSDSVARSQVSFAVKLVDIVLLYICASGGDWRLFVLRCVLHCCTSSLFYNAQANEGETFGGRRGFSPFFCVAFGICFALAGSLLSLFSHPSPKDVIPHWERPLSACLSHAVRCCRPVRSARAGNVWLPGMHGNPNAAVALIITCGAPRTQSLPLSSCLRPQCHPRSGTRTFEASAFSSAATAATSCSSLRSTSCLT